MVDITIRDFKEDEIKEISSYILNSTPYTEKVLQTLYPLTENPLNKAQAFCGAFRVTQTAMQFLDKESSETKDKIQKLLDSVKKEYNLLYSLLLKRNTTFNYGQSSAEKRIVEVFLDFDMNTNINAFINVFLVFSEKHELISTNKTTGLEMDTQEGKAVFDFINSGMEAAPINE